MQTVTQMANHDKQPPDDFGPPKRIAPEKTQVVKYSRTSGCSGGTAPCNGNIPGENKQNSVDSRINGSHTEYNRGASPQRDRDGYSSCYNISDYSHSARAMKTISMIDNIMWYGLWAVRLTLLATIMFIVSGLFDNFALLIAPR